MILQPDHVHKQIKRAPSPQLNNDPPLILQELLQHSNTFLSENGISEIKEKLKFCEEKIFISFSKSPNFLLEHLIKKSEAKTQDYVAQLLGERQTAMLSKIQTGGIDVKIVKPTHIKELNSELKEKLSDIKSSIMLMSSFQKKTSVNYDRYMEFRKKSYWIQSENTDNVKKFISNMRKVQSEHRRKYQQSLKQSQISVQDQERKEKQEKQRKRKDQYTKILSLQQQKRNQRHRYSEAQNERKEQIHSFLSQIKTRKPIHILNEERFKKEVVQPLEQERRKKLEQIRDSHHPIEAEQLQQHLQRYQQYKDNLLEQFRKKQEEEKQSYKQYQQQLSQLYHSKFHQNIQPRFSHSIKSQKMQKRKKIAQYSKSIIEKHKPTIDLKKQAKLKLQIQQLQLAQNKKKRKIVRQDGTVVFQDKPEVDGKKIGVGYLQYLRSENEGKPRKNNSERSASMMQLSQQTHKKIDYLRDNKPNLNLKHTLSTWKKVLDNKSFTSKDKYHSVMDYVSALDLQAKQREQMIRNVKKGDKAIQLKQQLDRYYLESVAAKMVVLKDVILKQ